jgi:hypothetical protein
MVVDEAHFIKNKKSQRSQNVLQLSERIRTRIANPLLMALTGTPLINDIEDFTAIWQFLGWIDETKPVGELMAALEETGLTPATAASPPPLARPSSTAASSGDARSTWPRTSPPAAWPTSPSSSTTRPGARSGPPSRASPVAWSRATSVRSRRGTAASSSRASTTTSCARWPRGSGQARRRRSPDENVFTMMRRIGQAKAGLAADYAAQLARNVGKVVFFAKHVDVMDTAEATFAKRGIRYASIRGDQTASARQKHIDAFTNDPDVAVVGVLADRRRRRASTCRSPPTWCSRSCRGPTPSRPRPSTASTASGRRPVTAWRIIAAQTIDTRIAQLIDSKAGLAARALDGADQDTSDSSDVQLEALVTLLEDALDERVGRQAS